MLTIPSRLRGECLRMNLRPPYERTEIRSRTLFYPPPPRPRAVVLVLTRRVSVCSYLPVVETLDRKDESCYGFDFEEFSDCLGSQLWAAVGTLWRYLEARQSLNSKFKRSPRYLRSGKNGTS
jgi:hypothetical protein